MKNTRIIKVQKKYRETGSGSFNNITKAVPWINLAGIWLEHAGFKIGSEVSITVEKNFLVVKAEG